MNNYMKLFWIICTTGPTYSNGVVLAPVSAHMYSNKLIRTHAASDGAKFNA